MTAVPDVWFFNKDRWQELIHSLIHSYFGQFYYYYFFKSSLTRGVFILGAPRISVSKQFYAYLVPLRAFHLSIVYNNDVVNIIWAQYFTQHGSFCWNVENGSWDLKQIFQEDPLYLQSLVKHFSRSVFSEIFLPSRSCLNRICIYTVLFNG